MRLFTPLLCTLAAVAVSGGSEHVLYAVAQLPADHERHMQFSISSVDVSHDGGAQVAKCADMALVCGQMSDHLGLDRRKDSHAFALFDTALGARSVYAALVVDTPADGRRTRSSWLDERTAYLAFRSSCVLTFPPFSMHSPTYGRVTGDSVFVTFVLAFPNTATTASIAAAAADDDDDRDDGGDGSDFVEYCIIIAFYPHAQVTTTHVLCF